MKQLIFTLAVMICSLPLAAELTVSLELVRPTVRMGEYIQLALSSNKKISRIDFPVVKDAVWAKNIQYNQVRNINGKTTYIRILALSPEKTGSVTIPSFKVHAGGETASAPGVKIRVLDRTVPGGENDKSVKISDVVKGVISILPARSALYAGEEITLNCDLLVDERAAGAIRVNYYPELLNVGNALFTTWEVRGGKVRFVSGRPQQITGNDRTFLRYRFTAVCRVLKPGPFDPGAVMRVGVVQSRSGRNEDPFGDPFGDGFFDSFFSSARVEPYTVEFKKAPVVEIKALPPVPAGVINTGLVGKWQISGAVSGSSLRQGEVAELKVLFSGSGSPDSFITPRLELPGFRVYPPEVVKKSGSVSVKYAVIPLEPGEREIKLCPGTFDPVSGKWNSRELVFKTAVAKGIAVSAPAKSVLPPPVKAPADSASPEPETTGAMPMHYQKNASGSMVKTPLVANSLFWMILFAAGFPVIALILESRFRKIERESNSPEIQRKREVGKTMAELVRELKKHGDTPEFREKLIPLLGESLGLSAGATAGEIATHVEDPELRRYFADLDSAAFLPGNTEITLSATGKKALVKLMKTFFLLLLAAGTAFSLAGAGVNEEFNRGNYKAAADGYMKSAVKGNKYSPDMLYNYGNCQYHLGNLPEARYALQLASLLRPWDREIRSNLDSVNARMFQNEDRSGSFSAMLRSLRDQLRCDNHILLASFFWGALWILWSFRRKLNSNTFFSLAGCLALFMMISVISAVTQLNSTYSENRITVVAPEIEMRTLPGVRSGKVETTIAGGGDGELLRSDPSGFSLVRINGREGWVDSKALRKTLPGGVY